MILDPEADKKVKESPFFLCVGKSEKICSKQEMETIKGSS